MTPRAGEPFDVEISVNFGAADHDLHLQLQADATGGELYRLLGSSESGLGLNRTPPLLTIERTGQALRHDQPLADTSLMTGDRLVSIVEPGSRPHLLAEFLTGPAMGEEFVVPVSGQAATSLGRTSAPGFDVPSVSRHHALVTLGPSGLAVEDTGSTNGTVVNGATLAAGQRMNVYGGDVVELGQISFRLISIPAETRPLVDSPFAYTQGTLAFQQAPRPADPRPPDSLEMPNPPAAPTKRRFPVGAAVLPLAMGGAMAYFFSPIFAIFMLLSPLMLAWTFFDDRRSGRKTFAADSAAYRTALAAKRLEAADMADQLAAWNRRRTPSLDQVARWVRMGAPELWARRPRHDDFLTVAAGVADQPRLFSVGRASGFGGGDGSEAAPDLARLAAEAEGEFAGVSRQPVTIDLAQSAILGITGGSSDGDGGSSIARALVAQLVGLRSYRDVRLAVLAPDRRDDWGWVKWLPHVRHEFPGGDRLIAGSDEEAKRVFEELMAIAAERAERSNDRIGSGSELLPHYVVVLHPPVALSPAAVARFLEVAPTVGMSVIFLAPDRHDLPGDVSVYIEVSDRGVQVHRLAEGSTVASVEPWALTSAEALALARDLAPIVDVTVSGIGAGIPSSVSLFDATAVATGHDLEEDLKSSLASRWGSDRPGLAATIGVGSGGPLVLDLQGDGPHGLVAGTTGAGKSEFLQTLIADLACNYSPTDLNFILIDYKGGSAFRQCERLPHTVGFVTDLDEHLADRALVSLRAELRHRERVLAEAEVSDLKALQAKYRHTVNADLVLPSLVIVIDEFAALKTEVPAFVDGLVDVAQRGRSMGVHMILATQKPGGVITPQIDANTNIRVALRVAAENDSRELIGVVDAAAIANDRPGRALMKIGGGSQLVEFQSAYVGGQSGGPAMVEPGLASFDFRSAMPRVKVISSLPPANASLLRATGSQDLDRSDLDLLVDAAVAVWESEPRAALRRPWLPPLADVVPLASVRPSAVNRQRPPSPRDLMKVPLGVADHPSRQAQGVFALDLVDAGHVALYGASGSGKSTLLRTLAVSLSHEAERVPEAAAIYGIDMGGGLSMIEPLPLVIDVIPGSDHERLQSLLRFLGDEVERRRQLLASTGAGSLAELHGPSASDPPPYIVVLIDGFGPFWDVLEKFDFGRQADDFVLLLGQSRSVGIHVVMTADQRSAIPFNCLGSVGLRCVQRLASEDEYRAIGISRAPDPQMMPPGRTLMLTGGGQGAQGADTGGGLLEIQAAVAAEAVEANGQAQAAAIAQLAERQQLSGVRPSPQARRIAALADSVSLSTLGRARSLDAVPLGLSPSHGVVQLDLVDNPTMLVAGSAGSGRSTALASIGYQLADVVADRRAIVTKRTSPLAADGASGSVSPFTDVAVGDDVEMLQSLAAEVEQRAEVGAAAPMLIAIDDADLFFDNAVAGQALTTIVLKGRDADAVVVMSASTFRAGSAFETWIRALRSNGHGLVLQPEGEKDQDLFDVRFPRGSALTFPNGRGYLVVRSTVQAVQVGRIDRVIDDSDSGESLAEGRMRR